jgi:hypothetical protein
METLVDIGAADAESFAMGYVRKLGKGRIVYLGSNPSPDLLRLVLEQEGVAAYAHAADLKVSTSVLRHRKDGSLAVFVIDRGEEPRAARVRLNLKRLGIGARER